ncbi:MAG: hypothetical protein PUC37_08925 [Spirochaetales bacterium]|nr:hypothetical protein [Spirochaetales bacterium]
MIMNEFLPDFSKRMFFFYKKLIFEKKEFVISKRILEESLSAAINVKTNCYTDALMNLQKLDAWLCLLKFGRFCDNSSIRKCLEYSDFMKSLIKNQNSKYVNCAQ